MMQSFFPGCLHKDFPVLGVRGVTSWWQIFGRQPQAGFVEGLAAIYIDSMFVTKVCKWVLHEWDDWKLLKDLWFIAIVIIDSLLWRLDKQLENMRKHSKSACYRYPMSAFKKKHNRGYWGVSVPGVLLFLHLLIKTKELRSWSYFLMNHGDANMGFSKRQRVVDLIALLQCNFITISLKKLKAQQFHMSNTLWCMFSRTCRNLFYILSCNSN